MFIDRARITVCAGSGGNGCLAFRREKLVPRGGPSGGDGGKGGDVYLECSERVNTLLHFQYKRIFKAERGRHGEGDRRHGRDGADTSILVPPGTQVFKEPEHLLLKDFAASGEPCALPPAAREAAAMPGLPPRPIRPRAARRPDNQGRCWTLRSTSSSSLMSG